MSSACRAKNGSGRGNPPTAAGFGSREHSTEAPPTPGAKTLLIPARIACRRPYPERLAFGTPIPGTDSSRGTLKTFTISRAKTLQNPGICATLISGSSRENTSCGRAREGLNNGARRVSTLGLSAEMETAFRHLAESRPAGFPPRSEADGRGSFQGRSKVRKPG
jgi:hypothetical protein